MLTEEQHIRDNNMWKLTYTRKPCGGGRTECILLLDFSEEGGRRCFLDFSSEKKLTDDYCKKTMWEASREELIKHLNALTIEDIQ